MNFRVPTGTVFAFALWVLVAPSARADITGETVARFKKHGRPDRTQRLAGSAVHGTFGEVLLSAGGAIQSITTLVSSAANGSVFTGVASAYQAHNHIKDMIQASGDQTSSVVGTLSIDAEYDEVVVVFTVHSNDDPIYRMSAAGPSLVQTAGVLGADQRPEFGDHGPKDASLTMTFYPKQMLPGSYPVLFYAKEGDCRICLSTLHTIIVNVKAPTFVNPQCELLFAQLAPLYLDLQSKQDALRAFIQADPGVLQHRELVAAKKRYLLGLIGRDAAGNFTSRKNPPTPDQLAEIARLRAAGLVTSGTPTVLVRSCESFARGLVRRGECPDAVLGGSSREFCRRVRDSQASVQATVDDIALVQRRFAEAGCGTNRDASPASSRGFTFRVQKPPVLFAYPMTHALIDQRSDARLFLTHNFSPPGAAGAYSMSNLAVVRTGAWTVYDTNHDVPGIPHGAAINVFDAPGGFVHTVVAPQSPAAGRNLHPRYPQATRLHHPTVNQRPAAVLLVTNVLTTGVEARNPHPVGVWYSEGSWWIVNQDGAAMPDRATFNVCAPPNAFVAGPATGHHIIVDRPAPRADAANGNPNALLIATYRQASIHNPHVIGVFYDVPGAKWRVFNEDGTPMPAGAQANILVVPR